MAVLTATSTASAQRVMSVGISGGVSLPTGDLSDSQDMGYNIGAQLNFAPPALPVELIVDAAYHSFEGKEFVPKVGIFGVTGNAAYIFPGLMIRPYVMGGLGMFFSKVDAPGASSKSDFGFNVGGGLRFVLSGFNTFLQARAMFIDDSTFIPISFGAIF
jgi:hypothetical protein